MINLRLRGAVHPHPQILVVSLVKVTVNAWPFQWRQVDTSLQKYIHTSGKLHCFRRRAPGKQG